MSGRVTKAVGMAAQRALGVSAEPRRMGRLVASDGQMLEVEGLQQPLGGAVRIVLQNGRKVRGEVVGFRKQLSLVQPFVANVPFAKNCIVEPDGHAATVACSSSLLGRVLDANGQPIDGKLPIHAQTSWPLAGVLTNPLQRGRITRPFDVGVRAINGLLTFGEGQRVAIVAGSGVGKSVLMGQMLGGAEADVVVIGLIGERSREVSDFVETKITESSRGRTVVIAVPADHPPLLRIRAAMRATAVAEYFRAQGKKVLLMIDSLTRLAHAQREIGLALGEPPTMKGYPPSALALLPSLIERAGIDRQTGGSITAIYTVLADGGDTEDPVVDTARAIVDGHIVLSRAMAEQGIYPAIDISKSLSRTMVDCVSLEHQKAAQNFRRKWSIYNENRDLLMMGAYRSGSNQELDESIARHEEQVDYLRQAMHDHITLEVSAEHLMQGFGS